MYPDMLPFAAQIRIACDHAKSAASSLSGKEAPVHEDNEKTFEELRGRIAKCLAYLDTFTERDFERTSPKQIIKLVRQPGKGLHADEYLLARQMPNFFFHVTTAYDLLRRGGVEIGKTRLPGSAERRRRDVGAGSGGRSALARPASPPARRRQRK